MNKKTLKKISRDFRTNASNVLNSHHEDFVDNLRLLIAFIIDTDLLKQYICSLPDTNVDMEEVFRSFENDFYNSRFDFGKTKKEIIVNTFKFLSSPLFNKESFTNIVFAYSHAQHIQDMVKVFGQRVILPFVQQLENYLNNIGIDMGIDDSIQYIITVNSGGQVNLSQDSSTINAIQNNNGFDFNQMQTMIDAILSAAKNGGITQESFNQLSEIVCAIKEELTKQPPKKAVITSLKNGLIAFSSGFATIPALKEAVDIFVQFIAPFIF